MIDKREFPRVELSTIVEYADNLDARARNVSETGLGILSRNEFDADSSLPLSIILPDIGTIKATGTVIWNRKIKSDLYTNGIKFTRLEGDNRDKIKQYVQKRSSAQRNTPPERRRSPRTLIDVIVNFQVKGSAFSKNINLQGICIITSEELQENSIIFLVILLPDSQTLNTCGRVVYCTRTADDLYENGIEFLNLKETDIDILNTFISGDTDKQ